VEPLYRLPIGSLEGEVHVGATALTIDPKLVGIEVPIVADHFDAKLFEYSAIKALARAKVSSVKVDVIEKSAALHLHIYNPFSG
jgi:hypothetical protein